MRSNPNFEIFKEPRGFIKIVEIGIAIFAFSTTAGYYSEFRVSSNLQPGKRCSNNVTSNRPVYAVLAKFEYPFDKQMYYISNVSHNCPLNINITDKDHHTGFNGKYKSESQFFVFTGVLTFLYCLVACLHYAMFEDPEGNMYSTDVGKCSFVVIDFVFSVVLVIFWFAGSAAWASGLPGFKDDTDPDSFAHTFHLCQGVLTCAVDKEPNYATLKVSVILGFLNLFVWLGNLWFLFKETPWHNPSQGNLHDDTEQ